MGLGRARAVGLCIAFAVAAPHARAQEPESPPPSGVEQPAAAEQPDVYQEATRLAAEQRWAEAAEKFRAALAIKDTAATRFNLAQAERNVGNLASAQREFARARDLARQEGAYDVHRLAEDALRALMARVPKLVIALPKDVRGVEARVDGKRVSTTSTILLDPGRHDLVVTATGHEPFVRTLDLAEGQKLRVAVRFSRPATRRQPEPTPRPDPRVSETEPSASGPPIATVLLAGVGVAAFTGAALLHLRRNDRLEEAARGCERAGGEFVCPASRKSDPEHRDLIESADRAELARDILIGVGVGAWGSGALWWILDSGDERPVAASVTPVPGGASARVRVAF